MSATWPAEAGCEICKQIVLLLVFNLYCITITWQQIYNGSFQVTVVDVLMHVTDC